MKTTFQQLNKGWNAEPNAPAPKIEWLGDDLKLTFFLNPFQFPEYEEESLGQITFRNCVKYRLGSTNDEGWYRGQCRFSKLAPQWGEFYEIGGDLKLGEIADDWITSPTSSPSNTKHFLFYFRDGTFECDATSWEFIAKPPPDNNAL